MPTASQPIMAESRNRDNHGKVISYMWYIHVLVKVNTEDRLRDHIAPFLQAGVPSCAPSPSTSRASLAGEEGHGSIPSGGGGGKMEGGIDDLTDYLILHLFHDEVLGQLVDTAPLLEQAEAYAGVLAGVPEHFRVEFCRRLYVILFSMDIVEWPPGIEVPDPLSGAVESPAVVEDGQDAGGGDDDVESPPSKQEKPEKQEQQHQQQHKQQDRNTLSDMKMTEAQEMAGNERGSRRNSSSAAATCSPRCPDDSDHDSEMARSGYFGTAANPLPWDYFTNWRLSRNGYGPLPESQDDVAESGSSHQGQPAPPHTTPQQQQHQQQQQQQQAAHAVVAAALSAQGVASAAASAAASLSTTLPRFPSSPDKVSNNIIQCSS